MLDVGGGSGAHAIGAVTHWPHLRAVVFDLEPVCEVAREFIAKAGLQDRIETQSGDMWEDPFPEADLHFYSNIYHDWSREKGAVGFTILMLVWSADGGQYSGRELSEMLTDAGFRQIETKPTFGYHSIVTGVKPAAP